MYGPCGVRAAVLVTLWLLTYIHSLQACNILCNANVKSFNCCDTITRSHDSRRGAGIPGCRGRLEAQLCGHTG